MVLNVKLIFLQHQIDLLGVCVWFEDFVKVLTHLVLLLVEPVEVGAFARVNVL